MADKKPIRLVFEADTPDELLHNLEVAYRFISDPEHIDWLHFESFDGVGYRFDRDF